jgi:hypothetical protein
LIEREKMWVNVSRGTLRFMLYEGALNAGLFLIFLQRIYSRRAGRFVIRLAG